MLLAIGFGTAAFGKHFRLYSTTSVVILIAFCAWTFLDGPRVAINLPTPLLGVWERINLGVFLLWVVVLATVRLRVPEADMKKVTSCSFSMVKGGNNESLYSRATRAS
jgi:hypothetical protein